MSLDDHTAPLTSTHGSPVGERGSTERIVALTLEFASRVAASESFDEICFLLTNDLRALLDFDRCFLITHLGGTSQFVAATHQPILDAKSRLRDMLEDIARFSQELGKPLILHKRTFAASDQSEALSDRARLLLQSFMDASDCNCFCCVPLTYNKAVIGHLFMEYLDENAPAKDAIMAVVKIAPVLAAALTGRWILEKKPNLARYVWPSQRTGLMTRTFFSKRLPLFAVCLFFFVTLFFVIPFSYTVGGEAAIVPKEKQYAFCKIGGLIDKVFVRRGSKVKKGQTLATLDSTDLDYKIRREKRQYEILTQDMALLKSKAIDDPSALVRIELLELKRKNVTEELEYLRWQKKLLEIQAPEDGIIVTADVETLSGKRFDAGQPFCEIAEPGLLCANIYVPEERITHVKPGQDIDLYLNNRPRTAYRLRVDEIAPRAVVEPRLGNVYEVKALFLTSPPSIRVGMKGIGKIHAGEAILWTIVTQRLSTRLHRFALYF